METPTKEPELLQPFYYDQQKLIRPPLLIYRRNMSGKRYYYSFDSSGEYMQFPSVTSIIRTIYPTSEYLIKWIADYGKQRADQIAHEKAQYGTLLHICLSVYLKNGKFVVLIAVPAPRGASLPPFDGTSLN